MKRELYTLTKAGLIPIELKDDRKLKIKVERVSPKFSGWVNALYWNVATLGKTKVYSVYDEEKVIHTSYVVRGKEKFAFLKKNDIEIGPCWTHPQYRGFGIYPAVLSSIIRNELAGGGTAYMIIREDNTASQRGVSKVGFEKTGEQVIKDRFKRHKAVL